MKPILIFIAVAIGIASSNSLLVNEDAFDHVDVGGQSNENEILESPVEEDESSEIFETPDEEDESSEIFETPEEEDESSEFYDDQDLLDVLNEAQRTTLSELDERDEFLMLASGGLERGFRCRAYRTKYECCISKKIGWIRLKACIGAKLKRNGFLVYAKAFGRTFFKRFYRVGRNSRKYCRKFKKVKVCVQMTNINPRRKSACIKVSIKYSFFKKSFKKCFRLR